MRTFLLAGAAALALGIAPAMAEHHGGINANIPIAGTDSGHANAANQVGGANSNGSGTAVNANDNNLQFGLANASKGATATAATDGGMVNTGSGLVAKLEECHCIVNTGTLKQTTTITKNEASNHQFVDGAEVEYSAKAFKADDPRAQIRDVGNVDMHESMGGTGIVAAQINTAPNVGQQQSFALMSIVGGNGPSLSAGGR